MTNMVFWWRMNSLQTTWTETTSSTKNPGSGDDRASMLVRLVATVMSLRKFSLSLLTLSLDREGSENGHEKFQAKELGLQSASHTVAAGNDSSHLADMRCQDCEEEGLGMDGAWCVECAMMLCRQCATFHLKSKRTRNHRLQTIEQENRGENLDRELAQAQERNDMFKSQVCFV